MKLKLNQNSTYKNSSPFASLSQMNPVNFLSFYFLKNNLNVIQ
jgi:hypothetical protein